MYSINLTEQDIDTIAFVGGRYGWSNSFPAPLEPGDHQIEEHTIWEWREAIEQDMEGGHSPFPMLDPSSDLYSKLLNLWQSIV